MSALRMKTVGEALVDLLEAYGVDIVFGIPGVHTAELYRGLASSRIRHVTPRHEQGAGFMADGYARVTGKPGVCFVITGPGLTNTITAMAQAREDSIPMLVISGVNARTTLGKGQGCLHELPDQSALIGTFAKKSVTLMRAEDLSAALADCFEALSTGRPGPVHLEIPTDVMVEHVDSVAPAIAATASTSSDAALFGCAAEMIASASAPVILAGGGAVRADDVLRGFAERIDAPVVLTANGRGLMAGHPLQVPASPSLAAVRELVAASDCVIAIGTEFGMTDYDMYVDQRFPHLQRLIRIDLSTDQIAAAGPAADVAILEDAAKALGPLCGLLPENKHCDGAKRAATARKNAWESLPEKIRREVTLLHRLRDAVQGARFVGDSTQLVYAGNLYFEASAPATWFNSATGFGSLGYLPPGAIGAALGDPARPVIAIVGDGGLQFSLAELGTAIDENINAVFLVWNNHGYKEIENYMLDAGISPEGVRPTPPDMKSLANAYGLSFHSAASESALIAAVAEASRGGAHLVEFVSR